MFRKYKFIIFLSLIILTIIFISSAQVGRAEAGYIFFALCFLGALLFLFAVSRIFIMCRDDNYRRTHSVISIIISLLVVGAIIALLFLFIF